MPRESLPLVREGGFKEAEKLFILAYEGEKTEPYYFNGLRGSDLFNDSGIIEIISLVRSYRSGTDPFSVKSLLKDAKSTFRFKSTDEFWLVVDRDHWETKHKHSFDQIISECEIEGNFFMALSNPCFEIWIILHFVDPSSWTNEQMAMIYENQKSGGKNYLSKYISTVLGKGYSKTPPILDMLPFTQLAIDRAKMIDKFDKYPKEVGTHIYKLVEKLIK
jgi:hypothetical protein